MKLIPKYGNASKNQETVFKNNAEYFISYGNTIVKRLHGKIMLDPKYWNYSVITGVYRSQFLNEGTEETKKKIKSGEYTLENLN